MNLVISVAKKELRSFFSSPVAFIFIGVFLAVTLFAFFTYEQFFVRNLADIRPLFTWLPVLLIFLVSALSMGLWSDEHRLGTLEVLFTLPVEIRKLVLGKFLGGMGVITIALALTLSVPITVARMGDLDFGPVFGGYLAAWLLAGAYLSIGLAVSSITKHQIVALLVTMMTLGSLYLLGSETVTGIFGTRAAEILSAISISGRFESIGRGVIELGDLVYFASVIAFALVLNTIVLESKRWGGGQTSRSVSSGSKALVALAAVNLLVLNVWLGSVSRVRLDLTSQHEYTISPVTKELLRGLNAPLLIRGYFSAKTHPLLAPLVPRIKDLVSEYAAISHGNVRVEFVDPRDDKELEKEANEAYGIKSFPFRVSDRYEAGVVNSYFSLLLKYGDQHEVLGFDELIEVQASEKSVQVKLRNLEYDLTKSIKKVAYSFQTLDSMFADLKAPLEFTAYITEKTLPPNYKDAPARISTALKDIAALSNGKFTYKIVDPDATPGMREELYKKLGLRPMAVSLFSQDSFYLHLLLKNGDEYQQIMPSETLSEADLKNEITAAVKRASPGFLKTVGLLKPKLEQPPQMPNQFHQQPPPPQDMTRTISEQLGQNYSVKPVELTDGRVPGDIDVLLVLSPKNLDEKQVFAIDQYLMRGGAVAVLAGRFELNPNAGGGQGLAVDKVNTGLESALAAWGVTVQDKLVLDPQNESFPVPVVRDLGGLKVRDIQLIRYPFFVDVRSGGMSKETPVTGGLNSVTMNWSSPIVLADAAAKDGDKELKRETSVLLRSTDKAWLQAGTEVQPDFEKHHELGFAPEGERKSFPLAVAIKGNFVSAFKDKPSPIWGSEGEQGDRTGRTLKLSPDSARLVVVASSSFVNDLVLNLSRQVSGDRFTNNLHFVENVVDWSVADVDLLSIRSRGTFARTLLPLDSSERAAWEYGNYVVVAIALGAIAVYALSRRRRLVPMSLDPSQGKGQRPMSTPTIGGTTEARS
ncbi:MAG: Gldg family protein [Myxococcota bacterium]